MPKAKSTETKPKETKSTETKPTETKPTETKPKTKSERDESVVFVGSKPLMSYITACVTQLNRNPDELCIKARGRAISRAVDVAEVLRNRFMTDLKIKSIIISTEQVQTAEGNTANVSAMEITLIKEKS